MRVTLVRLTLIAWAAWLLTLIVMACLSYWRVLHPSFLYMALPLAVQVICTIAVAIGGVWRLIRGPRRWNAVAWPLLGISPTLWIAAYLQYLVDCVSARNHSLNLLTRWAEPISSLLGEPIARVRYPYRYEGNRFVMWSDSPEYDERQMAAMDAHIRKLEESLGQRSDYKAHWVRGPVLNISGRCVFGWCLGSTSDTPAYDSDELNSVDRHEVAHFVMMQLATRNDIIPPMLLVEGWAQLHSGQQSVRSSQWQFWSAHKDGELHSLRELTGPAWYYNSNGLVYWQGAVLVDYLLRRFGSAKFLELCGTCREATFAEDVERVLGLSLDALDVAYRQDFVKQGPPDIRLLMSLKLGKEVNPDKWRRLVDDYYAGVERLRALFRQSSVTAVYTEDYTDKTGQKSNRNERIEYHADGPCQVQICQSSDRGEDIVVETPDVKFGLISDKAGQSRRLYQYATRAGGINAKFLRSTDMQRYLPLLLHSLRVRYDAEVTITEMGEKDPSSRILRVSYETALDENRSWRGWWDFDPEHDYCLVEANIELSGIPIARNITVDYQTVDGRHIPKTSRLNVTTGQNHSTSTTTIESCRFESPPPKVFDLATYGEFQPMQSSQFIPANTPETPSHCSRAEILAWIAGLCSLVGLTLAVGSRNRSRDACHPNYSEESRPSCASDQDPSLRSG